MNTASTSTSTLSLIALGGSLLLGAAAAGQTVGPDFNGDGFADLAIAAPSEHHGVKSFGGQVHVLYGQAAGLRALNNQIWHQDVAGLEDEAAANDFFGTAIAWGDFNNDGFDDLAVGAPGKTIDGAVNAGAVTIIYGSSEGLTTTGNQFIHQNSPNVVSTAQNDELFGNALASGDFNNDGFADLAIGVPGEDLGVAIDAGAVHVIYGSSGGLDLTTSQFWHQNRPGIRNVNNSADAFGSALASGDFNNDGFDDLAIGVPGENINGNPEAGAVLIMYGRAAGLTAKRNQFWTQNSDGIHNTAGAHDFFGSSLAVGDFNGDGRDDLAIGVPGETMLGVTAAGAVAVLHGSNNGLRAKNNQIWHAARAGTGVRAQPGASFGHSIAAGDFNGDGQDDLAIGIPGQWIGDHARAGAVLVLYSGERGLVTTNRRLLHQNVGNIGGEANSDNEFGFALATRDFNGDGFDDLAVGAPYAPVADTPEAGAVFILYGSQGGIRVGGTQTFTQDHPAFDDFARTGDAFGETL